MKNLIVGDVHGHFGNLRDLLLAQGVINENNERINSDTIACYSVGDLIDGDFNMAGDHECLFHAYQWFDKIGIGNHEYAFMGGPMFHGLRKHDRSLIREILDLEYAGVYAPAFMVEDYLVVHAGVAQRWGFQSEKDALEAINYSWAVSQEDKSDTDILDAISHTRGGNSYSGGGIFWNDWNEPRNENINQIVGHSPQFEGPTSIKYGNKTHWNIDGGGKWGTGLWGITLEDGKIDIVGVGKPVEFQRDYA